MSNRFTPLDSLERVLGLQMPHVLIIASAILVIITFFYIYSAGSYFKVTVWDLQERTSYFYPFEAYVISKNIDHLIIVLMTLSWLTFSIKFERRLRIVLPLLYGIITGLFALLNQDLLEIMVLLSLPIIISLLLFNSLIFQNRRFLVFERNLVINHIAMLGIVTGILTIIMSLEALYPPTNIDLPVYNYAYEIFILFSALSPILLVLLILGFPFKMITNMIITSILRVKDSSLNNMILTEYQISPIPKILLMLLFMGLSVTMVVIPHQEAINVDDKDIGVDTHYYVEWIGTLLSSKSPTELMEQTFVIIQHGDRPLTLFFFLVVANIFSTENLSYVFEHVPMILGPALIIIIYYLTRELTGNDIASLFSAFATAISFHTLVGIYAGAYANWLALIVGYLSLIFLFKSLKKIDKINTGLFITLLIVLLFTHIYTWSILIMVMVVLLLVLLKFSYYNRRNVTLLLVLVFLSILFDVTRMITTGSYSGIGYEISLPLDTELKLDLDQFASRWNNLIDTTHNFYGSLLGNFIIYALALYWLFRSRLREISTIFLVSFLSIGIIPLFLGNWSVQARVFYDIPFQIMVGIGLTYVYNSTHGRFRVLPVCIWLVGMSFMAVSNFYFFAPS